jgi:hypothetical protein
MPTTDVVRIDLDLPRDEAEEADLVEASARVFGEQHPLGIFIMNKLWKESGLDHRDRDDWRA